MKLRALVGALALAGVVAPAFATDGYFSDGYGIKAKGMAGVSIALPQDSLAAANNPAGMVIVGDRLDLGVDWFRPIRDAQIVGNGAGANGSYSGSDTKNFFIPEFGYNKMLNANMSVGVSVYGNGGMNSDYKTNPLGAFGSTGAAGIDLAQLFIAPTFAMKINPQHSIGISLNLAYQSFAAKGLSAFDNSTYSSSPGNVTGNGHDHSYGWGVKIGWIGQLTPDVAVGLTYQSKTNMSKFDKYKGMFANQGEFDIPESYGVGVSWKATPALTVAGDIKQINYSGVVSVGNSVDCLFAGTCKLGATNGPGFGWKDMTVYKLGVSYEVSKDLTLRAGYSWNKQPIPVSQTFLNILAPAVTEQHLTVGATYTLANKAELSFAYMHAFDHTVNGSGSIPAGFGGGNANLKMYQDSFGVAYGVKF